MFGFKLPRVIHDKATRLFFLPDSKIVIFGLYKYSALLNKRGNLEELIYDDVSNSSLTYRHSDLKWLLTNEENIL